MLWGAMRVTRAYLRPPSFPQCTIAIFSPSTSSLHSLWPAANWCGEAP